MAYPHLQSGRGSGARVFFSAVRVRLGLRGSGRKEQQENREKGEPAASLSGGKQNDASSGKKSPIRGTMNLGKRRLQKGRETRYERKTNELPQTRKTVLSPTLSSKLFDF